jgi:hypothetical protein
MWDPFSVCRLLANFHPSNKEVRFPIATIITDVPLRSGVA